MLVRTEKKSEERPVDVTTDIRSVEAKFVPTSARERMLTTALKATNAMNDRHSSPSLTEIFELVRHSMGALNDIDSPLSVLEPTDLVFDPTEPFVTLASQVLLHLDQPFKEKM